MHVEDITKVKAGRGTILITPLKENDYVLMDGTKIYVDTSFNKEKHSITSGIAVSVCDVIDDSLRTTIEVIPGDIVLFHYLAVMNAVRDQKFFECDGRKYYSIPYDSLYVVKREDQIICLNGFILVTPKMEHSQDKIGQIFLPDSMISKEQVSRGTVAFLGNPLAGEQEVVEPGDEIIFRKSSNVPLEYELHQALKKKYFRMKRDSILATSRTGTSSETIPLSSPVEYS